jgi:glycolate oxidase iron-sulfur subunit
MAPSKGPLQPAFDGQSPPAGDLVEDCVHCGFCLPTCPTYVLWGEEMDSPRGRIQLLAQALAGEPLSASTVEHFDRCLGCMACLSSCPSGVHYDQLLAATRAQIERRWDRGPAGRALRSGILAVATHPERLRLLRGPLWLYQRSGMARAMRSEWIAGHLPAGLRAAEALAPPLGPRVRLASRVSARGTRRGTVGLLTGCVQQVFFSQVNAATARVLAAEGFDVVIPPHQGCCGALAEHVGRDATSHARDIIATFDQAGIDRLIINAAGCGSAVKEYGRLLSGDPAWAERAARLSALTRDISEFLVEVGPQATRLALPMTVAYQDACHLAHAQRITAAPRALLAAIPGLVVREVAEAELCCGSAGIYNLLQPEAGAQLGERKARHILDTGAEVMVSANPGCLLQVVAAAARLGTRLRAVHTVEVLDASLRGMRPADL